MPRALLWGATALAVLAGIAAVTALLLLPGFIRDRVIEEARRRGIIIEKLEDVDVWFGSASFRGMSFRFEGVTGFSGTAEQVDVLLSGWDPSRVDAEGVDVRIAGSAATLALELTQFTARHPEVYVARFAARRVTVTWKAEPEQPAWLVLRDGALRELPDGAEFIAPSATVAGVSVGAVGARWRADRDSVHMGLGSADPAAAPVLVDVEHAFAKPRATVTLSPTPLEDLTGPLGEEFGKDDITVSGSAEMTFDRGVEAGAVTGSMEVVLDGYVPPHPVELNGFIFGRKTTFSTLFDVSEDRTTVDLTDSKVTAGSFRLRGGGKVERRDDHGVLRLDLKGKLSCSAVADSAARARLGSVLGRMLGDAAKRVVQGSVGVRVVIRADTRNLSDARVDRTIGVGCGLRPLSLEDLKQLGLPTSLEEFAEKAQQVSESLPDLPKELPDLKDLPIPSGMPPLPEIDFKIEAPKSEKTESGKSPEPPPTGK